MAAMATFGSVSTANARSVALSFSSLAALAAYTRACHVGDAASRCTTVAARAGATLANDTAACAW